MLEGIRSRLHLRMAGEPFVASAQERMVQPSDRRVLIEGPDPVRILVFGGDYAAGFNVGSRADALDGALARLVHERLGRGVIVENRSVPRVRLDAVVDSLGSTGSYTFHVVVWAPTFTEAVRRPGRRGWAAAAGAIIDRVEETSSAGAVLLGIPALIGYEPIGALARARAASINRVLAEVAEERARARFVVPPPVALGDVQAQDGAATYRKVAESLLPAVVALVTGAAAVSRAAGDAGLLQESSGR